MTDPILSPTRGRG